MISFLSSHCFFELLSEHWYVQSYASNNHYIHHRLDRCNPQRRICGYEVFLCIGCIVMDNSSNMMPIHSDWCMPNNDHPQTLENHRSFDDKNHNPKQILLNAKHDRWNTELRPLILFFLLIDFFRTFYLFLIFFVFFCRFFYYYEKDANEGDNVNVVSWGSGSFSPTIYVGGYVCRAGGGK